jgi:hypothetical protein
MSLYKIKKIEHTKRSDNWGEFSVKKAFQVDKINNKNSNVSGFVIQLVRKYTTAVAQCKDNIKRIGSIENFTNNNVRYMNHSYFEIFPVLNGTSTFADEFQNGAILRYEQDKKGEPWYANDNPPTAGQIIQTGIFFFISSPEIIVNRINNFIISNNNTNNNNSNNNNNKSNKTKINIFGIEWDINKKYPANGLPYTVSKKAFNLVNIRESNIIEHMVVASWNGIEKEIIFNNIVNNIINNKNCEIINENNRKKIKTKKTKLISEFEEINLKD